MENFSVYEDILNRTDGAVYVGVVGPVRTGKSTFVKRFMEKMVIPSAKGTERAVMTDELPQSAGGKTVMTTEPKFVPAKAAKISLGKGAEASVRLVDCVGFAVEGANGFEEDGAPRLVKTPWQDAPMPFEQAAEIGTQKVINEHSTIGVLVTTDGSVTELERQAYVPAEERSVRELKGIGKPFVIVLNCKNPSGATALKTELETKYEVPVVALNVEEMEEKDVLEVLQSALFEFPVLRIDVKIPKWLRSFPMENSSVSTLFNKFKKAVEKVVTMRDCFALETLFEEGDDFINPDEIRLDLGKGRAEISIGATEKLFYQVLSEILGEEIPDTCALTTYLREFAHVKREYEKVKGALESAEKTGYGIVYPAETDYALEKPSLVKKSAGYGVRFKAKATGYHVVKVDVTGEICPIIGTKQQGEDFLGDTLRAYEEENGEVWETNIFGKTLRFLVADELSEKVDAMPKDLQRKIRRTLYKIVNEGKSNLLCFVF